MSPRRWQDRTRRAVVCWTLPGEETDEEFECVFSIGRPEPRGSPYEGDREVELIEVRDVNGLRDDVEAMPEFQKALPKLEDDAIESVARDDEAAYADAQERRGEEARERRLMGWDY